MELLNYPWGVAIAAGWALTSDSRGHIFVFDKQSLAFLRIYDPSAFSNGLNSPHAMVTSASELFIADHDNHRLVVFSLPSDEHSDFEPSPARTIGAKGTAPGQLSHPTGLAICEQILYVSEFTGRRVQALTLEGQPLRCFFSPEGTRLLGLCASHQRVYVGDFDLDCVHVLDAVPQAEHESRLVPSTAVTQAGVTSSHVEHGALSHSHTALTPNMYVLDPLDSLLAGGHFSKQFHM